MSFIADMFDSSKGSGFQAIGPSGQQLSQTYQNTQDALAKQKAFADALNAANGIGNQSSVFNQLQGVAAGTGPNPAQAMLNQATGANVANQAALMASQRGASANPGMIARQAAQQGAQIQQNAAEQGATMQAQQSLGALGQMGGVAGQQAAQQGNALQTLNQAALQGQGNILQAQANANNANAGIAQSNTGAQSALLGGILGGAGAAAGKMAAGGEVPNPTNNPWMKGWGTTTVAAPAAPMSPTSSNINQGAALLTENLIGAGGKPAPKVGVPIAGTESTGPSMQESGSVPSMGGASRGAQMMSNTMARGGKVETGSKLKAGGHVPGKPKVKGDSLKNDNVHALLSPGEIVVPRSIAQGPDAPRKAAEFVAAILAKKGR